MATCPHADRLVPLLHDSELDSPLRREMVSHLATCITCTRVLSLLEHGQELLCQAIDEQVGALDFSDFWQGVTSRIQQPQSSWSVRLRLWYERWRPAWSFNVPAWAALATILLLTIAPFHSKSLFRISPFLAENPQPSPEIPPPVRVASNEATIDNQAQIESLSAADTVAMWNDPENNFTVIWVGDDASGELP